MLPSKALSNLTDMSADDAVALLVKTSEATFVSADFVKTALPAWINELVNPTTLAGRTARNSLIGGGLGGVLGAINERSKPEEDRGYMTGAGRGALLGGLAAGTGTLIAGAWPDYDKLTTEEQKLLDQAKLDATAQADAAAGNTALPALDAVRNKSEGVTGVASAVLDPRFYANMAKQSPYHSLTGAAIGGGVGAGTGRMVGNYFSGIKSFGAGGDMSPKSFVLAGGLKGLAGPHAPNASYGRTGATLGGGVLGALGGAVLGNGVSALIERFRGG